MIESTTWRASAATQWRPWSPETRKTTARPIAEESHLEEGRWGGLRTDIFF